MPLEDLSRYPDQHNDLQDAIDDIDPVTQGGTMLQQM